MTRLWQDDGLCLGSDPRVFDPDPDEHDRVRYAKGICGACPVKVVCLRSAIREEGGAPGTARATIRGGYTGEERYAIYRRYVAKPRREVAA